MASFDNLTAIEPWMSWYPDAFARETESALTKALQQSFFNHSVSVKQTDSASTGTASDPETPGSGRYGTNLDVYVGTTPSVWTGNGAVNGCGFGSDPETPGSGPSGRSGSNPLGVSGATRKRKSRASKRSMTTFIQTDAANFRRMVQEVTGVKLPGSAVVKPEPIRQQFSNKLQGLLPTLDTSAYLLDVQSRNTRRMPVSGFSQLPSTGQPTVNGGGGMDFYSVCSFPTLESSI